MNEHEQHTDRDLDDRLRRLAAGVVAPDVSAGEDVARGRRRLVRQRLAIGGACLATVAALGLGTAVAPGIGSADGRPDYAGGSADPDPAPDSTPPVRAGQTEITPSAGASVVPGAGHHVVVPPPHQEDHSDTLVAYQQVLAEHLDPSWEHLVRYTHANGNQQTGTSGTTLTSLGSKYGWTVPGESGLGMLQVSVNASWSDTYWQCGSSAAATDGWSCHEMAAPGARSAEIAEHDGVVEVAVEHQDGQVVVLTADSLFGNNSLVPVSGMDITQRALAAAAADDRLSLPGGAPDAPPLIGNAAFDSIGRAALLADGERLGSVESGGSSQAWVAGRWLVGGQDRGELMWEATALLGPAGGYGCLKAQFTRCTLQAVDGADVFLGHVRSKWGGGWHAIYNGPSYQVRVVFEPAYDAAAFPVDRAFSLVTDDRLQPLN